MTRERVETCCLNKTINIYSIFQYSCVQRSPSSYLISHLVSESITSGFAVTRCGVAPATLAFRNARLVRPYKIKYIFLISLLYRSNIYCRHDTWYCPSKLPVLCSHLLLTSNIDISKFLCYVALMCRTFWKFKRSCNNDNIVKFVFKFVLTFQTPETIDY
jgi:hypothetical protein